MLYNISDCGRQFIGGRRLDSQRIIEEYIEGKQTLSQLAMRHGVCIKTIWNHLKKIRLIRVVSKEKDVALV